MIATQSRTSQPPPQALGINVEKPKFPQYAVCTKRFESFETWPEYLPVSKNELVEAGLVYTGVGDSCRCYHCGGGLRNWEQGDVPMKEHAKWYPKCPHLLLVKGQVYIDKVRSGEPVEETSLQTDSAIENEQKLIDSPAALSCIQMGYSQDIVQKSIGIFAAKNGHNNFKGADLCEILFEIEENPEAFNNCTVADSSRTQTCTDLISEDLESLTEENERLKESQLCKVCVDKPADIIFLPCGHMVCCPQCAPAMSKCPICRKTINGQIKAYFASVIN